MTTILLGSISVLADTSELQRRAYNEAFDAHGLDWRWDRGEYRAMLTASGGRERIADHAERRRQTVDVDAVHATKGERFRALLAEHDVAARPGVLEVVIAAHDEGTRVGVVTSTSPENVRAVLDAIGLDPGGLAWLVDRGQVEQDKPAPDAYREVLGPIGDDEVVAVEDNVGGIAAASAAGLPCVAFPNENTVDHDLGEAVAVVDRLDIDELRRHARAVRPVS